MGNMKLGLQMWSIHNVCVEKGMDEALRLSSEMGYKGFEFALGDCATLKERVGAEPAEVKKALNAYGIQAIGSHISWEQLLENPDPVLKDCTDFEVPYAAIAPVFYGDRTPFEDQRAAYKKLVEISRLFKSNGIQLQVHCAAFGFLRDYKGRYTVAGMFEECGLEYLQPEFDTAWLICSEIDPHEYLMKYKNFVDILHLKDYHAIPEHSPYVLVRHNTICDHGYGCGVGENGVQDVGDIIKTAEAAGTKWIVTELWNEPNALERAKASAELIKKYL